MVSPALWTLKNVQSVDGRPFNLRDRPFLFDILTCDKPKLAVEKCVQIGMTVIGECRFVHKVGVRGLHGIYFLPTDDLAGLFVNGRFDPFIQENPELQKLASKLDNVQQKKLGSHFAYFMGLKGLTRVHSTPADHETFDEYDLMGEKVVETAHNRLENSPFKECDYFSKPSIPDYGIDRTFNLGDRRYWTLDCPHCSKWVSEYDLLAKFPECIRKGRLMCLYCDRPLDVRIGEWVAMEPSREMASFHISRLIDPLRDPQSLVVEFENSLDLANFYTSRLGLPYVDMSSHITKGEILENLCTSRPIPKNALNCTAGVDVGHKYLKVVISQKGTDKPRDYVYIGTLKGEDAGLWRQLKQLFVLYDVRKYVIDGEPETQSVKDFIKEYRRDGWACDYIETMKDAHWDEKDRLVKVDRTRSLDASHRLLRDALITLPSRQIPDVEEFADHCQNLKRQRVVDDKGAVSYTWVHNESDPDHFRHALNYDALCYDINSFKPVLVNKTPPDIRRVLGLK